MWRDLPASDRTLLEKKTREEVSRVPVESIRHFNAGTQPLISGSFAPSPVDDKAGLHRAQTTFSEGISRSNLPMESSIEGLCESQTTAREQQRPWTEVHCRDHVTMETSWLFQCYVLYTTTLPGLLVSDALHFKRYSVTLFRRQLIRWWWDTHCKSYHSKEGWCH